MNIQNKAKIKSLKNFYEMLDYEEKKHKFFVEDDTNQIDSIDVDNPKDITGAKKKIDFDDLEIEDRDNDKIVPDENADNSTEKITDILNKIDFNALSTEDKIELVERVIDSLQETVESDEEFTDVLAQIQDVIDSYIVEEPEEEEEEEIGNEELETEIEKPEEESEVEEEEEIEEEGEEEEEESKKK